MDIDRSTTIRPFAMLLGLVVAASALTGAGTAASPTPAAAAAAVFNYAEALQKAVWFYDAQRLGRLPADNRVTWRGNSFLTDGADAALDLTGGFADAGDHIKATFPLAHSLTALAWGMLEAPEGYGGGQAQYLLSNLRWGMDYLIRANPAANRLVTEVGDPNKDHSLWAAAEVQTYLRETYLMGTGCWGADLADSTAAAFAAAAMVFQASDPTYAATLLSHARGLYATTESLPKAKYDDCTPIVKGFYNSWSGFNDELVWGSIWLYRATGEQSYLDKAEAYYGGLPRQGQDPTTPVKYSWTYDWDDKTAASVILLAKLIGKARYLSDATNWADFNTGPGVAGQRLTFSPGGQAFYGPWGSLRYSAGAAFIAFVLADSGRLDATRTQRLHDFAVRQINYVLGDNPSHLSYLVGFGPAFITRPHHRTAHGSWSNNVYEPVEDRHTLYGGLVGGPAAADDNYGAEDRNAFQKAEVALDYNAGLTSALARMVKEFGGTPLANFPPVEAPDHEIFMTASLNQASSTFVEIKSLWYNHTAWPARFTDNVSFRYYFTLDPATSAADIKTQVAYAQCAPPGPPTQFQGNVYFVTISCAGQRVGPIGQSESRRENQFRITWPGPHDYTRDWSFAGVSPNQATPVEVSHITVYDGTRLVWGTPPGPVTPPGAPGKPAAANVTATSVGLSWTAATPGSSPIAGYQVYRVATGGDVRVASVAGLSTVVSGLTPATAYTFYVKAVDSAGLAGAASASTGVTTLPAAPPGPAGTPVASGLTATAVTLTWTASSAGDLPIARYEVWRVAGVDTLAGQTPDGTTTSLALTGLTPNTGYTFYVLARDSGGQPSAASGRVSITTPPAPAASVKAQYKNNDSSPGDNQIKPGLNLVNGGGSALTLSSVVMRYYFTAEAGASTYGVWCDYAYIGCGNVTLRVVAMPTAVAGADHYLEVGFGSGAGTLAAGASLVDMQLRFNKTDWSAFTETNDYSFGTATGYADTSKVTVYAGGQLVWGSEPS